MISTKMRDGLAAFALLVSTGDEILPEHLNLPSQLSSLELIEQQISHVIAQGSEAERAALTALITRLNQKL